MSERTIQTFRLHTIRQRISLHQRRIILSLAAGGCFFSELIHLWLLPEQVAIYYGYGAIFFLIAVIQGIIGANLLFKPGYRILTFGWVMNLLFVLLYTFTHIIGIPIGQTFYPLPFEAPGVIITIFEFITAILLLWLARKTPKI